MKPVILVFVHYYLPGFKSGGPVRTVANMVDHLGDSLDFRIITADRDLSDDGAYPNVKVNDWNEFGSAKVYYLSPDKQSLGNLVHLISKTPHDLIYLNSFFDANFSILPLLASHLRLIPQKPVVIAPRGEFSPGALAIKPYKKKLYLNFFNLCRLKNKLIWQASSEYEAHDIRTVLGGGIVIAPDLPPVPDKISKEFDITLRINDCALRVIFISRISTKKNLSYALRILSRVNVPVEFNIYGPIDDENYWKQCRELISGLPENVTASYKGPLPHNEVHKIMSSHDVFFFPTLGENYGHVIQEALSAGTPVLISDTTPWRDLETKGVGWDIPLNDEDSYIHAINYLYNLPSDDFFEWRKKVHKYAAVLTLNQDVITRNLKLFMDVAQMNSADFLTEISRNQPS